MANVDEPTESIHWSQVKTYIADADLSLKQFFIVVIHTDAREVALAGADKGDGVLLNDPKAGEAARVAVGNGAIVKVKAGGTFAAGDELTSDANGKAVKATVTDKVLGKALQSGVLDDVVSMEIQRYIKEA